MSRLVTALAHAEHVVAAETDGAVHADLPARVVLTLGGAHHGSCRQRDNIVNGMNTR